MVNNHQSLKYLNHEEKNMKTKLKLKLGQHGRGPKCPQHFALSPIIQKQIYNI